MADTNQDRKKEVKLEELLRLKREERPSESFWNDFDRELHQRMLQTLVKKDPWYVQLLRGVTGRIAQTTAVGAAAVFLAMLVVRPALVDTSDPSDSIGTAVLAQATQATQAGVGTSSSVAQPSAASEVATASSDQRSSDQLLGRLNDSLTPEYGMDAITSVANNGNFGDSSESGYTSDYSHDSFEVASYDRSAYVTDSATSFAGASLATGLIY